MRVWWESLLFTICATFCACGAALIQTHKKDITDNKPNKNCTKAHWGFNVRVIPMSDEAPVKCKQLRQMRIFSDGNCTSPTPITDSVCMGKCQPVPNKYQQWRKKYNQHRAGRRVKEWRCVEDFTRMKKVTLVCNNGTLRTIEVKVVETCKCKLFNKKNKSKRRRLRRKRRRNKKRHQRKQKKSCRHNKKYLSSNSPEL